MPLVQEDGDYLLQEIGDWILLEQEHPRARFLEWESPSHSAYWADAEADVPGSSDQVLTITRGEDVEVTFTTSDPPGDGISAWTLIFTIAARSGGDALITVEGAGIAVDDAEDGTFTVTIEREETAELEAGNYRFDVWRADSGNQIPLCGGALIVKGSVRSVDD